MNAIVRKLFRKSGDPARLGDDERWFEDAPAYQRPDLDSKIRMRQTIKASVNGFQVQEFVSGQTYEVTASLAESLIKMGAAVKI